MESCYIYLLILIPNLGVLCFSYDLSSGYLLPTPSKKNWIAEETFFFFYLDVYNFEENILQGNSIIPIILLFMIKLV